MTTDTLISEATNLSQELMERLCDIEHSNCFACRDSESGGLGLTFRVEKEGVRSLWTCPDDKESYKGIVHGGILATILDSSMVHALFARGIVARTGSMEIRYHNCVRSGAEMEIVAGMKDACHCLYHMEATIHQDGLLCVSAKAKFMAETACSKE